RGAGRIGFTEYQGRAGHPERRIGAAAARPEGRVPGRAAPLQARTAEQGGDAGIARRTARFDRWVRLRYPCGPSGGVAERWKAHAWKVCNTYPRSWVRDNRRGGFWRRAARPRGGGQKGPSLSRALAERI